MLFRSRIEYAVIEDMENAARARGYDELTALYVPTAKNKPVADLYPSAGYAVKTVKDDGTAEFAIDLKRNLSRDYCLNKLNERD